MPKYDKFCTICGKHYLYCSNCDQYAQEPLYKSMFCSQECVDLYELLTSYEMGNVSKEDARKILKVMDQDKMGRLQKSLAAAYKKIMADDEIQPTIDIKEQTDIDIANNAVKKAVSDTTAEAAKNVPRSIAYKKKN